MTETVELKMTPIEEGVPARDEMRGEQTILTYNDKVGTWDIAFMESGWDDFDAGFALGVTHWLDITNMWPGVIAQVQSFTALTRSDPAVRDRVKWEAADEVGVWLEAALQCKDWHWDGDQYAAAEDALKRLRSELRTSPPEPASEPPCETCYGTGNEAMHSICRDCDGLPAPPAKEPQ